METTWPNLNVTTAKMYFFFFDGFSGGSAVKNPLVNVGDASLVPGLGRFPREGNGNPPNNLAWEMLWTEEPGGL